MARHHGPVLVDTNVILESHRIGSWRALAGGYRVETVEDCFAETQAGKQRRRPEQRIDANALRTSMAAVHRVGDRERAELAVRVPDVALDRGEASLWAHAVHREDSWLLCGPDTASLRFGLRLGFRDRLVSLERLLDNVGQHPIPLLRPSYTRLSMIGASQDQREALGPLHRADGVAIQQSEQPLYVPQHDQTDRLHCAD